MKLTKVVPRRWQRGPSSVCVVSLGFGSGFDVGFWLSVSACLFESRYARGLSAEPRELPLNDFASLRGLLTAWEHLGMLSLMVFPQTENEGNELAAAEVSKRAPMALLWPPRPQATVALHFRSNEEGDCEGVLQLDLLL